MAVIKAVSSKAGIGHAIDYVTKKEKTEEKLVSGLHCEPETVKEEMQATKELWGKTDGRTYKHYVQSYHEDEEITPEQAHKNAVELAEHTKAWKGHEVLIATHIDKGHIHTHFIVNSVNYENGHKLQWSKHDLKCFNTANIIPSTISVTTSFLAVYLTFRRSPYFALAYAANDIVLIILWILASLYDIRYVSVVVCFIAFFANDIYGFVSWRKMKTRQQEITNVVSIM
jgi:hypothetical protein